MSTGHTAHPANAAEIEAFVKKLQKWTESLPESEQSLAHLLVQQARDISAEQVQANSLKLSLAAATREVFKNNQKINLPNADAWVEIGPIWQQRNKVEWGEEVEVTQRVALRNNR